ncbi:MAG: S1 RNA-binding domain-containing protein, partial [Candidatus Firestonebacteria bacterium]|nr:S1 RNA-binding domain-containing protein [Candidatus Firestonebacteria bacterium]
EFLTLKLSGVEDKSLAFLRAHYVKADNAAGAQVYLAMEDAFKRLLSVSLEAEVMVAAKKKADEEAIGVFGQNLRELLLAPPLGPKRVLAMDPGFRTGCKLAVLDGQGKFLFNHTIFPTLGEGQAGRAAEEVKTLVAKFGIEAIAIGNGTASRETEAFVRALELTCPVIMVNESGASIYSASEVAREEFPDLDLTVRGAISIGRRLVDPLAELVKIDPKSIGVGQYQHDVNQRALKQNLDDVVVSCVNAVGVDVNTASKQLLTYVSGLGEKMAANVVTYRNSHGPFDSREALKNVPKLGSKAFEQAAGFLRIPQAENPLDTSAVHPERYALVETMARDLGCSVKELMGNKQVRDKIDLKKYVGENIGLPTLTDILAELDKPGRDPRKQFEAFAFAPGVHALEDLQPGMTLPGIVTNVTNFGAFVDIGVHQDGLVHISELSDTFVQDANAFIKVQQKVQVKVLEVDLERRRVALSMKSGAVPRSAQDKTVPARSGGKPGGKPAGKPPASRPEPVYAHEWQRKLASLKK